ncbi:NAD-dependent epimerase/dehydratase family protein [Ahrensia kielensis]|uniref:NAD-dependent epimerase/dehydratase family protein n=1 Tax=Ahrensia kielensis TaxID=76980 RepID=UPI00037E7ACC|nr:NAD-dependent epimerase/dehydratase family protein [Ahrensia kielensis]
MRFLVIGGNGFIGRHVVKKLLQDGYKVRVFDQSVPVPETIKKDYEKCCKIDFVLGDFTDKNAIFEALQDCQGCIHLATTTLPATSNADIQFDIQTNLIGTIQLLELMNELGIKRFVFLSSGGTVYGDPIYTPIDETHPTQPKSSYGIVKLTIENYCHLYKQLHGLKATVLRLSNPYGPGQSLNGIQGVIPIFSSKAAQDQEIEIWGDGSTIRDYIYIDDVVNAIISALNYDGDEIVFNIGSGTGTSLTEIINTLERILNKNIKIKYLPSRTLDASINVLNIKKSKNELKWEPKQSIETGLPSVIKSIKERLEY